MRCLEKVSPILKFLKNLQIYLPKLEEEKNILNATIVTVNLTAVPVFRNQFLSKNIFFSLLLNKIADFRGLSERLRSASKI